MRSCQPLRFLIALVALFSLAGDAAAVRLTEARRKAIALVAEESATEAAALERIFEVTGYDHVPLARSFVDGVIGRDSVRFLDAQLKRLEARRARRPFLDAILGELRSSRDQLERHGFLNFDEASGPVPLNRLVLDELRVDERSFAANRRTPPARSAARLAGKGEGTILVAATGPASPAVLAAAREALAGRGLSRSLRLVELPEGAGAKAALEQAASGERIDGLVVLRTGSVIEPGTLPLHTDRDERALYLASEVARAAARRGEALRPVAAVDGAATSALRLPGVPTALVDIAEREPTQLRHALGASFEAIARVAVAPDPKLITKTSALKPGSTFGMYRERGARSEAYDDLADEHGRIRPPYQAVATALASTSRRSSDETARAMNHASEDYNTFRAYPRIVSAEEFADVERGMRQLERTFQAALRDLYSPRSRLIASGLITREELEQAAGYDPSLVGRLGPKARFDFILRPDLVRDEAGKLAILEVNHGYVGGLPSIPRNRELMQKVNPRIFDSVPVAPTEDFLPELARSLGSLARGNKRGKVVFFTYGKQDGWWDKEDFYLRDALKREGVEYVSSDSAKKLVTERGKVWLEAKDGTRERVDVVYSRKDWASPEMQEAHLRGAVSIFPSPGSSALEAKNLYKKLPQLIRTLLKEEPVFRFLESRSFAGKTGKIDERFLEQVFANPKRWVVKSANDAQGAGVLVGRDAKPAELAAFRAKVLANPGNWDAQEFVAPGTLNGERVDLDPYLITARGKTLIPKGAMVRSAKLDKKFGDAPRNFDAWVLDGRPRRDPLADRPRRSTNPVRRRAPSAAPRATATKRS